MKKGDFKDLMEHELLLMVCNHSMQEKIDYRLVVARVLKTMSDILSNPSLLNPYKTVARERLSGALDSKIEEERELESVSDHKSVELSESKPVEGEKNSAILKKLRLDHASIFDQILLKAAGQEVYKAKNQKETVAIRCFTAPSDHIYTLRIYISNPIAERLAGHMISSIPKQNKHTALLTHACAALNHHLASSPKFEISNDCFMWKWLNSTPELIAWSEDQKVVEGVASVQQHDSITTVYAGIARVKAFMQVTMARRGYLMIMDLTSKQFKIQEIELEKRDGFKLKKRKNNFEHLISLINST